MTEKGFIADHSKKLVDDNSGFYTHRYEDAIGYSSQEAAALRAKAIIGDEPSVTVVAVEFLCPPNQYPWGWLKA